jgi:hypothetical protein
MRILLLIAALLAPTLAEAGTSCRSYKSGSYTKTYCSHSGPQRSTSCVSYMSGSVRKTSCS